MKKPKGFLHLKYEISVGRHDKTSPVVATGNLAMIVIWVIIENLLAVRALVDGSHAAKLSEAAPTDVLLDAQHQEIVSTRFQAEVVGFPGISALWALDACLIAILVPNLLGSIDSDHDSGSSRMPNPCTSHRLSR